MRQLHPTHRVEGTLGTIARTQVRRDRWPDFDSFDADRYDEALRRATARQWWRRAREEYGSIHEFTQLAHALTTVRAPIDLLAALSRLITDEARHALLCADMATALDPDVSPERAFEWSAPRAPWVAPKEGCELAWAADAVLTACCIGETLSRPLFEALATVITDPVPESVVRQILRDEHLHATFGWEALRWMRDRLDDRAREGLQQQLAVRLGSFERSCVVGDLSIEALAGKEISITPPGPGAAPNLGLLTSSTYAMIFYATLEGEIFPRLEALGLDPLRAWRERR